MKEQLEERLRELKADFETGQQQLAELEGKQTELRQTMLRISGAVQVLEEELARSTQTGDGEEESTDSDSEPEAAGQLVSSQSGC